MLDLPLGSHTLPMPEGADLTPVGLADLIADAFEALALEELTLVANDTGGALCHIFVKRSSKIPASDIHIAHQRWADFKARMDANPRVPPRAAGSDAP